MACSNACDTPMSPSAGSARSSSTCTTDSAPYASDEDYGYIDEEEVELDKLLGQLGGEYAAWRLRHRGVFVPLFSHECSRTVCVLNAIPVFSCGVGGLCLGPAPPSINFLPTGARFWSDTSPVEARLGCSHNGMRHALANGGNDMLFCCLETGTPHFCGQFCALNGLTTDGALVCSLTGRVVETRNVSAGMNGFITGAVRQTAHVKELTPSVALERASDLQSGTNIQSVRTDNHRDKYFATAVLYVMDYLRLRSGENEYRRLLSDQQIIHREVRAMLRRTKHFVDIGKVVECAAQQRTRCTAPLVTDIPTGTMRSLATLYATRAMALWAMLVLEVPGGREFVRRQSFINFVAGTLSLCQSGIDVRDPGDTYDINILHMDPLLGIIGASDHLHPKAAARDKRIGDTTMALLRDAVAKHAVNPQVLHMDEMATSIDRIPYAAFDT